MDWREAAASGLPAPRDDEPASLRQNILDELADHLDCALKRELTKNISVEEALENVKGSFGDPRDVAQRLWLEAMRDKLMSNRLTLAAMALMTSLCVAIAWFAWSAQRVNQQAIALIQETNAQLVQKLDVVSARPVARWRSNERVPIHFHLICDDEQKSPARGYQGTLSLGEGASSLNALHSVSNDSGDLDFGVQLAGTYQLTITTPWQESTNLSFEASPGFPISSPILCPAQDWKNVELAFEFPDLPSLKNRDALILCGLSHDTTRRVGGTGRPWNHSGPSGFNVVLDSEFHLVYVGAGVSAQEYLPRAISTRNRLAIHSGNSSTNDAYQSLTPTDHFVWLADGLKLGAQKQFPPGRYTLHSILVLLRSDLRRFTGERVEQVKPPQTLLTWEHGWTPFAFDSRQGSAFLQASPDRKNTMLVQTEPYLTTQIDKMLLASASRIPEPANTTVASSESATGAAFLNTFGMQCVPERSPEGFPGLRLKSVRDDSLADQCGLENGDLLLAIEGWNVNGDRELGWALQQPRPQVSLVNRNNIVSRDPEPRESCVALLLRDGETLLYELDPKGPPTSVSSSPSKRQPRAKARHTSDR